MLAFRAGDGRAFDSLFRRWAGPLLRYLERMVRDAAIAEELVQEAFLRVHRARERYEPEARFSTWLYRIATNLALNELRRPHRRHAHTSADAQRESEAGPAIELAAGGPAVDEAVGARLEGEALLGELERLPERQRTALWLSAGEGLSYAEVAKVMETTEKSVKSLVHRARVALIDRMGGARGPARASGRREADRPSGGAAGRRSE